MRIGTTRCCSYVSVYRYRTRRSRSCRSYRLIMRPVILALNLGPSKFRSTFFNNEIGYLEYKINIFILKLD